MLQLNIKHQLLNILLLLLLCISTTANAQSLNWQLTQIVSDMDADYVPALSYPVQISGTFNAPKPNPAAHIRRLNIDYREKSWKEFCQLIVLKIKVNNLIDLHNQRKRKPN